MTVTEAAELPEASLSWQAFDTYLQGALLLCYLPRTATPWVSRGVY